MERLNRACLSHGLDAILPTDMPTAYTLATLQGQLTPRLGVFPLPDRETLERFDDKWRFSQYLSEQGVPQPEARLLRRPEDLQGLDLAYPVIVKPRDAAGASGNVATEDVVWLLNGLGIDTGIDLDVLVDTAAWISARLGRDPASRVARARVRMCSA